MSLDEGITSEVNASIISEISPDSAYVRTKFIAIIPKKPHSSSSASSKAVFDDDGDLVRDCNEDEIEFVIKHKLSTDLRGVGYQVWRGALLMSDYIIANVGNGFTKKSVLEIGAGTGLASIALSHFCSDDSYIYATDLPELVDLLKDNLDSNNSKNIEVFPLDLKDTKDNAAFEEIDIVIGADVIYDNDVTDGVINFLQMILHKTTKKSVEFIFTIDKRYIFTIDDMETVAPSYEYFIAKLTDLDPEEAWNMNREEIPAEQIHQTFCYERSPDLCLILIKSTKKVCLKN